MDRIMLIAILHRQGPRNLVSNHCKESNQATNVDIFACQLEKLQIFVSNLHETRSYNTESNCTFHSCVWFPWTKEARQQAADQNLVFFFTLPVLLISHDCSPNGHHDPTVGAGPLEAYLWVPTFKVY